jgi:hypothetical protein
MPPISVGYFPKKNTGSFPITKRELSNKNRVAKRTEHGVPTRETIHAEIQISLLSLSLTQTNAELQAFPCQEKRRSTAALRKHFPHNDGQAVRNVTSVPTKRRSLQSAGRPAADPKAGRDANGRTSHGFPAASQRRPSPPIVRLRGPFHRSMRK